MSKYVTKNDNTLKNNNLTLDQINENIKKMKNYRNYLNKRESSSNSNCHCTTDYVEPDDCHHLPNDCHHHYDDCHHHHDTCKKMSSYEKSKLQELSNCYIRDMRDRINHYERESNHVFNKHYNYLSFKICGQPITINF